MNCPKCGAALLPGFAGTFECNSASWPGGFIASEGCLRRQIAQRTAERDALAARVKELEEVGDAMHRWITVKRGVETDFTAAWTRAKGQR